MENINITHPPDMNTALRFAKLLLKYLEAPLGTVTVQVQRSEAGQLSLVVKHSPGARLTADKQTDGFLGYKVTYEHRETPTAINIQP